MEPLTHSHIGGRVREARENQGLSRRRLARRAGIARSGLARIEDGSTTPTVETLERLAIGLDMGVTSLWAGDDVDATEVRMLGPRDEIAALGGGARPKRVLEGEGMLRVTRSFWHDGELFEASSGSVTRCIAPDHPAVRANPFCVEPAYAKDGSAGVLRFLELRRRGKLGRDNTTTRNGHGLLPPTRAPRQDWRLR